MNYGIEDIGISRKRVQFEVEATDVKARIDAAYRSLGSEVRMKGFRPGHVPRKVLEQRFGRKVQADVASDIINGSWREIAPQLRLAGPPQIEARGEISVSSSFTFTIGVDVKPDITVQDYKGVELPFKAPEVQEEQLQSAIGRRLQRAQKIMEVTEDRPVAEGDIVITQVVLKDGDTEVVREEGTALNVNAERYYPGVEKLVIGLRRGEEKTESVTIGDASQVPGLAGKIFEATVKPVTIQTSRVPELTDDVAKELGYEGGIAGMRDALSSQIRNQLEEQAKSDARSSLLWKVVEKNEFDVPASMVEERYNLMVEEAKALHVWSGKGENTFNLSPKAVEDYRKNARMNVRASLVLEAISRQEDIHVTEDDLQKAYQRIADERGQAVEAIKGYFVAEDAVGLLRDRLLEQKTLDWVFESAVLVAPTAAEAAPVEPEPTPAEPAVEPAAEPVAVEGAPEAAS